MKFGILIFFSETCQKNSNSSTPMYIYDNILVNFFLIKNILARVLEKIKTQILRLIIFFSENSTVYEMMCRNVVEMW
jgi:hypothetical protein